MEYIFDFITGICTLLVGWLIRKILYLEGEVMKLRAQAMPRQEMAELITLKQEAIRVIQQEQKEDIQRLENKLDYVINLLTKVK